MKTYKAELTDEMTGEKKVAKISIGHGKIEIAVEGYGEMTAQPGMGQPIVIEVFNGRLRVITWPDINCEEPTVIAMEGAREELYQDFEQQRRDEKHGLYGKHVDVAN